MEKMHRLIVLALVVVFASGCAVTRSEMDVAEVQIQNPPTGQEVKFVSVQDERGFELEPGEPSTPSLKNGEIDNEAITSRAIARKRNGYGQALGDILLPESKTVSSVVENRLSRSFAEKGYRVLSPGDAGYESAMPLAVDIQKFWGWFNPGFFTIDLSFEIMLRVTGPVAGLDHGATFGGRAKESFAAAVEDNWRKVMEKALENLDSEVRWKVPPSE